MWLCKVSQHISQILVKLTAIKFKVGLVNDFSS